jgi:hypothetical protein
LMRGLDFPDRGPWKVPFHGAVYRLAGELPCVAVGKDAWVDVSPAFATGSAVATLLEKGTVVIETRFAGDAPINPIASGIHGDAEARTRSLRADAGGGPVWTTELTRSGGRRTVFRFALDRPGIRATARLTSDGEPSINLCSQPPTPLFRDQGAVDVIRPHFDNESYYGAGWSEVQFAGTGRIRFAAAHAALLLPLAPDYSYRIVLDLSGPPHSQTTIALNGVPAGTCSPGEVRTCAVEVQPLAGAGPVSTLTLVTHDKDGAPIPPRRLMFRGARIERTGVRR